MFLTIDVFLCWGLWDDFAPTLHSDYLDRIRVSVVVVVVVVVVVAVVVVVVVVVAAAAVVF